MNETRSLRERDADEVDRALSFFASVVKSGESWTPTCQETVVSARAAINRLRARAITPSETPNG